MTVLSDARVRIPQRDGSVVRYELREPRHYPFPTAPLSSRVFYAAVPVIANPLEEPDGTGRARIDWDATLEYRHHIWRYGLGVADAMDTAQRGSGLDWRSVQELIARSCREAAAAGGRVVCGVGTDQLADPANASLAEIVTAYLEQLEVLEQVGGQAVILASRALAARAGSPDDYLSVYDAVLSETSSPVILHWLGDVFDPTLAGYWGSSSISEACDTVIELINRHPRRVDGVKVSLLDASIEIDLRGRLPGGVRLYTGDDFNYAELIDGDSSGASDALLGIFSAIAPAASYALQALDVGDRHSFRTTLDSTLPLARHVFAAPTWQYKTGIVFILYLNGHLEHFRMVGGMESARSIVHLSETFMLADQAGLLVDPAAAVRRMRRILAVAGVDG